MRRLVLIVVALGGFGLGLAAWWRNHRRFGSAWVNRVVNPWLARSGIFDHSAGEIGLIEHVGRTSGIVRVTPVHPVPTAIGVRIVVPLGSESQWARNVLAAGRCRLQLGPTMLEFDEPALVSAAEIDDLPRLARRVMDWLGFRYLVLHRATGTSRTPTPAPSDIGGTAAAA